MNIEILKLYEEYSFLTMSNTIKPEVFAVVHIHCSLYRIAPCRNCKKYQHSRGIAASFGD
jgi:hypothetical protein